MKAPPAALPVELVEEILLRLPPDEPAWLLRASLVCKAWGSVVSHRIFRRRLHELYPAPPVLGFLRHCLKDHASHHYPNPDLSITRPVFLHDDEHIFSHFIPTTASSLSLPAPASRLWGALDCRHGRALFLSKAALAWWRAAPELLVWEPFTGVVRRVPLPPLFRLFDGPQSSMEPVAAVYCAADGCDHRDCHGGPFRLVFVFTVGESDDDEYDTWAWVYSSEPGTWGDPTSVHGNHDMEFMRYSSVLVGSSLLCFISDEGSIVEYDLERHGLTVVDALDIDSDMNPDRLNLVLTEDSGMRVCQELHPLLKFWRSVSPDAQWVLSRVINLDSLPQIGVALMHNDPREASDSPDAQFADEDTRVRVVGFAEQANLIFVETACGIFTIELQSEKVRKVHDKVWDKDDFLNLIPVVGFYTPVPRVENQDPSSSGPSEEAGGEDEKAVEQPQQLFDKGSNAIEDDEEEDFVSAGFSHAPKTRVLIYKEVALECAITEHGCVFGQKSQEVDIPLYDATKSVPNEESVTGAANKDDAGSLKTSQSDVKNAAAPSRKGDSQEERAGCPE